MRDEVPVGGEDFGAEFDGPEGGPGDDRAHLVQAEQERGDDAEVSAAAADRPVQVGVLVRARAHVRAVGQDEFGLQEIVDGQPALTAEMAEAAAQGETADAGRGDDAARGGETVLVGGAVHFAPDAAAADADGARPRVDLDVLERGQIDDHTVVAGPQARAMVPAAAHRERQAVVSGEADGVGDVLGIAAARHEGGPPVDHRVVDGAGLVVAGVVRSYQLAGESSEFLTGCLCRSHGHACPPFRVRGPSTGPIRMF